MKCERLFAMPWNCREIKPAGNFSDFRSFGLSRAFFSASHWPHPYFTHLNLTSMNFKQFASILAFSILSLASVQAATIKKLAGSWKGTITEISDGEKFTVKVTETNKVFQKRGSKAREKFRQMGNPLHLRRLIFRMEIFSAS